MTVFAGVIINISNEAVDRPFTYRVPEDMEVSVGECVEVPFGKGSKLRKGYVIFLAENTDLDPTRIKEIAGRAEKNISVQEELMRLAVWMSSEYGTTLAQCLKTVLPVKRSVGKNRRRMDPLLRYLDSAEEEHELNPEQQKAVSEVCRTIHGQDAGGTSPAFLLYGITGSGKTEVYLHIISDVIREGKKVIFLIPEISLTYQTVLRISSRFRGRVAILNSRMSAGERYEQYGKCERGEVDILVGPRSAVFAPFENLGLIIIDEEQEGAYKSETAPRYQTRDVARKRAELAGCPLVYGSATPSLSLFHAMKEGKIRLLQLTHRARPESRLPETEIVDLRKELEEGNRSVFSGRLQKLIREALEQKEQIMLFLNRRGYSDFLSCRSCGKAVKCPHCDVTLTLHRDGMLRCHYCGYEIPRMRYCPNCGSPYLSPFGLGTEKLEYLTAHAFPDARILRMDADTTKVKNAHEKILSAFRNHEADILIGTQMIVKGHDFPDVTVVGIVAADLSLSSPDFNAQEKTFDLLTQAAGRAGRDRNPGHVVIQMYQPDHYALRLAPEEHYELFYEKEMAFRKLLGYPPFEYLETIQLSCGDEKFLNGLTGLAVREFRPEAEREGAALIGPMNATVYKLRDVYRKIVYIKHPSHDIIIRLRDCFQRTLRKHDPRVLIQMNFDLQ